MIRLFLKTIVLTTLLIFAFMHLYYYGYVKLQDRHLAITDSILAKGSFALIMQKLSTQKPEQWQNTIKQIQQASHYPIEIIDYHQLHLSSKHQRALQQGKIVFVSGHEWLFLNYGDRTRTAYQRIGKSNKVLAINAELSIVYNIKDSTALLRLLALSDLSNLQTISKAYDIPMSVVATSNLPSDINQQLHQFTVAFEKPKSGQDIQQIYYSIPNSNNALSIGPIQFANTLELYSEGQRYYFYGYLLFAILVVLVLTWAFGRNVKKLYQLTDEYGTGKFDSRITADAYQSCTVHTKTLLKWASKLID